MPDSPTYPSRPAAEVDPTGEFERAYAENAGTDAALPRRCDRCTDVLGTTWITVNGLDLCHHCAQRPGIGEIAALKAENERLRKDKLRHIDYSVDLQRIIEDLCNGRPIREPKTGARYHYEIADRARAALETEPESHE